MMLQSVRGAMDIETQLSVPGAHVQLVHYHFPAPSFSNFCCAFRRALGMTPGQFRQLL